MPKFYRVAAGYTTVGGVAEEGQIIPEEDMVHVGTEFKPMTEDEQLAKWGRILYEEYTPEEGEPVATADAPPPPTGDSPIAPKELADEQRAAELPGVDTEKARPRSRATSTSQPSSRSTPPQEKT